MRNFDRFVPVDAFQEPELPSARKLPAEGLVAATPFNLQWHRAAAGPSMLRCLGFGAPAPQGR
eukprot:1128695-Alexandrium_andersonii.AAC.1